MVASWKIVHYRNNRNDGPVIEFINNLPLSTRNKTAHLLELLSHKGFEVRMPYSKQLYHNLYELRVRGKIEVRIFYSFFGQDVLLLHGFIKKRNKLL